MAATDFLRARPVNIEDFPLRLHFQPIVGLADGRVFAYEALLRLQQETGSLLSPADFLGNFADRGLMPDVTRWVIRQAVGALQSHADAIIFVNLDEESFADETILAFAAGRLAQAGVARIRLGFEVNELTAIRNTAAASDWLLEAKRLGFLSSLDDFGSGLFTTEHLVSLPIDVIKLDRTLVERLFRGESTSLLKALKSIAAWHRKALVAEGIADAELAEFALRSGIPFGQGYYLGRPVPEIPAGDQA